MPNDGKIKAKDLSYDSSLPPFLQRLKDRNAGRGDPDRHEQQFARPRRAKDSNDDDGPTVIDESGETVSKEEFDKLTKPSEDSAEGGSTAPGSGGNGLHATAGTTVPPGLEVSRPENKITDGKAVKKRKLAKVIGEGDDRNNSDNADATSDKPTKGPVKKAMRKAKPIKLAFDQDDET